MPSPVPTGKEMAGTVGGEAGWGAPGFLPRGVGEPGAEGSTRLRQLPNRGLL